MGDQQCFFAFRQIAKNGLPYIGFCFKYPDNIILDLERLADQDPKVRDLFDLCVFGTGQDSTRDHGAVKGIARGLKRIIKEDFLLIHILNTFDADSVDEFAHGGKGSGLDKIFKRAFLAFGELIDREKSVDGQR